MAFWLLKSEPFKYSWDNLVKDGRTHWDGIRNYQARNYMRAMKVGEQAIFYHSNEGKEAVGTVTIVKEAYPDPSATSGDWSVVEVAPQDAFTHPVSLDTMRSHPVLQHMNIFRQMRLSVVELTEEEFSLICRLGVGEEGLVTG